MSSWETPNTTAPIFDQTQAPAHIAQGSCVEYKTKSGRYRPQAEQFYRKLQEQGLNGRVGMESSGHSRWFERLLRDLQFELWIGDAAEIRTKRVRKQKTDRQDAQLLLRLMLEDRFPRIWVPDAANRWGFYSP